VTRVLLCFFVISSLILLGGSKIEAAGDPLVPVGDDSYKWVYDHIRSLQLRGYLLDLNPGVRPYLRREIARSLTESERQRDLSDSELTQVELRLLERLRREFASEMRWLEGGESRGGLISTGLIFKACWSSRKGRGRNCGRPCGLTLEPGLGDISTSMDASSSTADWLRIQLTPERSGEA